jgi:hypothetical protein
MSFVPKDFVVPTSLIGPGFRLEPLTVAHNVQDYAAWHGSINHIRATPGFTGPRQWPLEDFSLEQNRGELAEHEDHFARRVGFTYSVLSSKTGEVIGCLYLYPAKREGYDVDAKSWVRSDFAELDKPLYDAVSSWLATEWPFKSVDYAKR